METSKLPAYELTNFITYDNCLFVRLVLDSIEDLKLKNLLDSYMADEEDKQLVNMLRESHTVISSIYHIGISLIVFLLQLSEEDTVELLASEAEEDPIEQKLERGIFSSVQCVNYIAVTFCYCRG